MWDLENGQEVRRFPGHSGGVKAVAALPRGWALSAGNDGTVRLWDLESGEEITVFTGDAQFSCCAVTTDARFAIAGDRSGHIHVFEILL